VCVYVRVHVCVYIHMWYCPVISKCVQAYIHVWYEFLCLHGYVCMSHTRVARCVQMTYGVAMISRLLENIGLFCRR